MTEEQAHCAVTSQEAMEQEQVGSNDLLNALRELAEEWIKEGEFLDNPHDNEVDRQAGRIYKFCARELKKMMGSPNAEISGGCKPSA